MAKCNLSGESLEIKIKEELVSGVDESTGFYKIARNSYKFEENISEIESPTIREGRDQSEVSLGSQAVTGEIEVPFDSTASYLFLKTVFGDVKTTVDGSKFAHEFTVSDNCLGTLQIEDTLKDIGSSNKILGVKVNTFDLDLGEEGQINAKFGMLADYKYMNKLLADSGSDIVTTDAAINTKTIEVNDTASYKVDDTIIFIFDATTVTTDAVDTRTVELDDTSGIAKNDFLFIGGKEVQVQTVSATGVYLNRKVTVSTGSVVELLNNEYTVAAIGTTTIELETGLIKAIVAGDEILVKRSNSTFLTAEYFDNNKLQILDTTTGNINDGTIEKMAFSFSNEQTAEKTISKNNIVDGRTKIETTIDVIINKEIELILENAKNDYKFDMKVEMVSNEGNSFLLNLYNCKVVPMSYERGAPGLVKAQIKAFPLKDELGNYIKATLKNGKETY